LQTESEFGHAGRSQLGELAGHNYGGKLDRARGLPSERERGIRAAAASCEFHSHGPVETAEWLKEIEGGFHTFTWTRPHFFFLSDALNICSAVILRRFAVATHGRNPCTHQVQMCRGRCQNCRMPLTWLLSVSFSVQSAAASRGFSSGLS